MSFNPETLEEITQQLQNFSRQLSRYARSAKSNEEHTGGLISVAARLLREMALRRQTFTEIPYVDPDFSILLDLYVHESRGKSVSITSACLAAQVPLATGLRHVATLERDGLVQIRNDPADRRRRFISLTPPARDRVTRYLAEVSGVDPVIPRQTHDVSATGLWRERGISA